MLQEPESALPGAAGGTESRKESMEQLASSSFFFFTGYLIRRHLKENKGAGRKRRGPRLKMTGFLALDNSPLVVGKRELGI